jgi:hypothetical protein
MRTTGAESPPCTVTARYDISLKRPTPTDSVVKLRAWVVSSEEDRCDVASEQER